MDNMDNYSNLPGATSALSTNTILGELAGVMSLHSNNDIQPPDRESSEDLDDSIQSEAKHVSNRTSSQGDFLLQSFMELQINKEGLEVPNDEESKESDFVDEPEAQSLGRELRRLADAFENSYERQEVKKKAISCTLNIETYAEFAEIAKTLFNPGGITHSRIVVLFFFCADIAIRTLKECIQRFRRFFGWFFKFLADYIYSWVERNGGWFAVLNKKSYKKYIISSVVVCLVAVGIYKLVYRK